MRVFRDIEIEKIGETITLQGHVWDLGGNKRKKKPQRDRLRMAKLCQKGMEREIKIDEII